MVDVKKITVGVLLLIILVILIFQIIGGTATDLTGSADSVTDANNCSEGTDTAGETYSYNLTTKYCINSTGNDEYVAGQYDLPLNTLFGSSGVLILIFMVAMFIVVIGTVIKGIKTKK